MSSSILPISGNTYIVQNAAAANVVPHVLDNENGNTIPGTIDGNPILSYSVNSPITNNQIWKYLVYPSTTNQTVFTLQSVGALNNEPQFNGLGGYIRVDTSTQRLVQGGAPLAWILLPVDSDPTLFKMTPYDDVISNDGNLLASDINNVIQVTAPDKNTAELIPDSGGDNQLWSFVLQDPV